jgi:hypothetical protein
MMFGYSKTTFAILIFMILTGAAKTIGVSIYYQLDFDDPLMASLLFIIGSALALPIHYFHPQNSNEGTDNDNVEEADEADGEDPTPHIEPGNQDMSNDEPTTNTEQAMKRGKGEVTVHEVKEAALRRLGSATGLTRKSKEAIVWVHRIPWWCKPIPPSIFNIIDAVFRWFALVYLPASVSEMLITGLELVFSVVAARMIRKRLVSKHRWLGVGVMCTGLVLVGSSGLFSDSSGSLSQPAEEYAFGIALVFGKIFMGVSKDLLEELFLQESQFPALLLVGMEGGYGLLIGLPLYFLVGPSMGYDPVESFQRIGESALGICYTLVLIAVFLIASISTIMATAVTSSMTRNMWRNFRGLVVWVVGMMVFYATSSTKKSQESGGSDDIELGEEFLVPGSFMILTGFLVMLGGLSIYYISSTSSSKAADTVNDGMAPEVGADESQDDTTPARSVGW